MAHTGKELALGLIGAFCFVSGSPQAIGLLECLFSLFKRGDVADDTKETLGGTLPDFGDQQEFAIKSIVGLASDTRLVAGECFASPGALMHSHRPFTVVGIEQVFDRASEPLAARP